MKPLLLVLCLSGCATTDYAVIGSGLADLHSTRYAMRQGAVEVNPIVGQSLTQQALVKAAGIGVVIGGAHLLDLKGKPVAARIVRLITVAVWSAAAWSNYRGGVR